MSLWVVRELLFLLLSLPVPSLREALLALRLRTKGFHKVSAWAWRRFWSFFFHLSTFHLWSCLVLLLQRTGDLLSVCKMSTVKSVLSLQMLVNSPSHITFLSHALQMLSGSWIIPFPSGLWCQITEQHPQDTRLQRWSLVLQVTWPKAKQVPEVASYFSVLFWRFYHSFCWGRRHWEQALDYCKQAARSPC